MVCNAEEVLKKLMKEDPKIRAEYKKNKKLEYDPRVTKIGKFLRKTSLDEFRTIYFMSCRNDVPYRSEAIFTKGKRGYGRILLRCNKK